MAEGILMGAALGGGGAILTGNDPLQGAALGGAMGGVSAGFGAGGVASGAGASAGAQGASHLAQTGAQQAASNAALSGGLGSTIGSGFSAVQDMTGITNRDMSSLAIQQAMQPKQQMQAAPMGQGISRPQVDLSQGGSVMNSNPRIKKLQMQGLL